MDLGSGIAIAGVCVALTSAIMKFVPRKYNKNNPGGNRKYVEEKFCDERVKHIEGWISSIEKGLGEINKNVLEILKKIKL